MYIRAMMLYGQVGFGLMPNEWKVNLENAPITSMMSMLLLNNKDVLAAWDSVFTATSIYVGQADDVSLEDYKGLIQKVYGESFNLLQVKQPQYEAALIEAVKALPEPQINAKLIFTKDTTEGKQYRVMGQRYTLDSDILQSLMEPVLRPVPTGLDVLAAFGSEEAETLINVYYEPDTLWPAYTTTLEKLKELVATRPEEAWTQNLYNGWLWSIQATATSFETTEGVPRFMQTQAWTDKSLYTALGSYAELKHDTVLYSKQAGAEMGGYIANMPYIYVEPNVEVYTRLLQLVTLTKESLGEKGLLSEEALSVLEQIQAYLEVIESCAMKELTNESFTEEEYYMLTSFGGMVDYVSVQLARMNLLDDAYTTSNHTSALISDVATIADVEWYLEMGTGIPNEIYVICPYKGQLFLAKGATFSYYEFVTDERLTDEVWHEMIGIETVVDPDWGFEWVRYNPETVGCEAYVPAWATSFISSEANQVETTGLEIMWDDAMLPNNPQTWGEDW